jgi:AbrB family looped-hinge helix DNA binding protein
VSSKSRLLGTDHLAAQLKISRKYLRRLLRSLPEYDDGVYTPYKWSVDELSKLSAKIRGRQNTAKRRAIVTSKGQLVIPAPIRDRYHIKKGTQVYIEEVENGILLKPITDESIERVCGILADQPLPDDIEKEPDRDLS